MAREYPEAFGYEWDENKRAETLRERGIDFASMDYFDWETAIHQRSDRGGEGRWSSFGLIGARLHHVIWTERGQPYSDHQLAESQHYSVLTNKNSAVASRHRGRNFPSEYIIKA